MGCSHFYYVSVPPEPTLTSINIQDRNGFSEIFSSKDRLCHYENVDFCKNQPYQKVLRIYSRDSEGNTRAYVNSYHPNGQPKQYLEIVNNRAYGTYREWHLNGTLKVEAFIIGGEPDIDTTSEKTWLFDGLTRAWDEDGHLLAEIPYCNGELQGLSIYYHVNGAIWKTISYNKGKIEGAFKVYLIDGSLLQTTEYVNDIKHGHSYRYWNDDRISAEEFYRNGLLITGKCFDRCGELICTIEEGAGYRALFGKVGLNELHQYYNGVQEGAVKVFNEDGTLKRLYHVKNGIKDGTEIEYFTKNEVKGDLTPKLLITWLEGKIQGITKTWYPNGVQESQRELIENLKNGLLTAWYQDGSVMLIEEYEKDKLINGEYFISGEILPVSEIKAGKGTATLFDSKGNFLRKISYYKSKPQIE